MTREEKFMYEAVNMGIEGMRNNLGGPFGCVIVKDDEIIGKGCNSVIVTSDPTAHAEIVAIRDACMHLQSFQLNDCEVYTTCEPCPMCMGAIYWARPKKCIMLTPEQMLQRLVLTIPLFIASCLCLLKKEK